MAEKLAKVSFSNLDKILYPKLKIAPKMLPFLADRPLVLKRPPNGVDKGFYAKDASQGRPTWVKTARFYSEAERNVNYILCNDLDTLIVSKPLEAYHSKRDFSGTTEPKGDGEKKCEGRIFVVQEHHASRLHYDFRLERGGVLKSWAVPKGIPESTDEKRLAVETEDHPIEYASFEGIIPEGHYGAGTVKIWDKGTYELKVWDEKMVEFTLHGENLRGRYVLVRLKKAGEKSWLMLKGKE